MMRITGDMKKYINIRMWWNDINIGLNQLGYWQFDE